MLSGLSAASAWSIGALHLQTGNIACAFAACAGKTTLTPSSQQARLSPWSPQPLSYVCGVAAKVVAGNYEIDKAAVSPLAASAPVTAVATLTSWSTLAT